MREEIIERYLAHKATTLGALVRKVKWIGRVGAPDRVIMLRGKCFWVELKAPGKRPGVLQQKEHSRMRAVGQDVRVIDTRAAADAFLDELCSLVSTKH